MPSVEIMENAKEDEIYTVLMVNNTNSRYLQSTISDINSGKYTITEPQIRLYRRWLRSITGV